MYCVTSGIKGDYKVLWLTWHFFLSRCCVCFKLDAGDGDQLSTIVLFRKKDLQSFYCFWHLSTAVFNTGDMQSSTTSAVSKATWAIHFGVLSVSCLLEDAFIGCGQELFLLWRRQLRMQWCTSCRFILVSIALCTVGWASFAIEFGGLVLSI